MKFVEFFHNLIKQFIAYFNKLEEKPKVEAPPVKKEKMLGVDVSHHNGNVNWDGLKKAGVEFVFLKATQGVSFVDPMFKKNFALAKSTGMKVGAYHFFEHAKDGGEQAKHFLRVVNGYDFDLPLVLDWEQAGGNSSQIARAKEFLDTVGGLPIIYTGPSFITDLKIPEEFAKYPLWIAHYKTAAPRVPPPWKNWTYWQDSETAEFPGVNGKFDRNHFNPQV